jgi:uncharacterized protein (TIGR00730 family)
MHAEGTNHDRLPGERSGVVRVPTPAHPFVRRVPLPWQRPKPPQDDPDALSRVHTLLASPAYRLADADTAFLAEGDARGVRLQLDYQKAETLLEQNGIEHTIVVFGSTRVAEPNSAERRVEELRAVLAAGESGAERLLKVAERIRENSRYYEVARELGRLIGRADYASHDGRMVVMTGGGPGIMEAANRGAFDVGAKTVGLNINLPHEQYPNPYITPDLCFRFHYFALRKLHFLLRAKALVVFPGGFGTCDELFETLALIQTRKIQPLPVVLVGETFWRRAINIDFMIDEGVIDAEDGDLFWYAETAEQIWDSILEWYQASGSPLIPVHSGKPE